MGILYFTAIEVDTNKNLERRPSLHQIFANGRLINSTLNMASTINTDFGLNDKISKGLHRQVDDMQPIHPIEMSERHFAKNQEKAWNDQLRKMQGLHAPLKLMFEKKAVAKVGHFACMSARSNFQLDILEGNDDIITFNDILAQPEHYEGVTQPHDAIENQLVADRKTI